MKRPIEVLMCGSRTSVKGGMTTVVESFLRHEFDSAIRLKYIPTHTEKGKVFNVFYFGMKLFAVAAYLVLRRPAYVHLHMSERGSFVRKYIVFHLGKSVGSHVVVHTHGAEFKQYYLEASLNRKKQILRLLKEADRVIVLGESWERILQEIEPETNTEILMNAVPIPVHQRNVADKAVLSILFLAVLIERKGILDLIEAAVGFLPEAEREEKKVQFHIAGDGELMEQAKQLTESLGIAEKFVFHGWIGPEKKEELLKEADLFVLPSYNEGLPLSILEAMSFGIPVISTDVGSVDEAVVDGVNGYLIRPGDRDALTESLVKCLNGANLGEMGEASRELVKLKFDEQRYFEKVEAMYCAK